MTPEEQAVLEAALAYIGTVPDSYTGLTPLAEAVRAYRESLEPPEPWSVKQTTDGYLSHYWVENPSKGDGICTSNRNLAMHVKALLNESEYKHLPGR